MTFAAKLISLLIIGEGILYLFFPSAVIKAVSDFCASANSWKRKAGFIFFAAGAGLIYLALSLLSGPFAHWVVAVCGVFLALTGLFIFVVPDAATKFLKWFYIENKAVSFAGFFLIAGGLLIYIFL